MNKTSRTWYHSIILLLALLLPYFFGAGLAGTAFVVLFAVTIVYRIDGRIPLILGLLALASSPLMLVTGNTAFADRLAVFAYYFLFIGVVRIMIGLIWPNLENASQKVSPPETNHEHDVLGPKDKIFSFTARSLSKRQQFFYMLLAFLLVLLADYLLYPERYLNGAP